MPSKGSPPAPKGRASAVRLVGGSAPNEGIAELQVDGETQPCRHACVCVYVRVRVHACMQPGAP